MSEPILRINPLFTNWANALVTVARDFPILSAIFSLDKYGNLQHHKQDLEAHLQAHLHLLCHLQGHLLQFRNYSGYYRLFYIISSCLV